MTSMLRSLRCSPCRPLTYNRLVTFTLNQDTSGRIRTEEEPATPGDSDRREPDPKAN